MESKKELIPSQPSDNKIKKGHEDVLFDYDPTKEIEIEKKKKEIEENLKKLVQERYEKIEQEKEKIRKEKIKKDLSKTETLNLSDINNTGIIPTISLEKYKKDKADILMIDVSRRKEDILAKTRKIEINKNIVNDLNPPKISLLDKIVISNPKLEKKKEEKEKKKIEEREKIRQIEIAKEEEASRKRKEKELAKKAIEDKKFEKELRKKEKESKVLGTNAQDIRGLTKKGEKEDKRQKAIADRKRKQEEKERLRVIEDAKRKEKIRIEFEQKAVLKKEEEERKLAFIKEKQEKLKKIEREKEQAREERREKARLIQKAKEESKQKAKDEHKTVGERIKDWYENLSIIKDRKNRLEMQKETLLIDYESAEAIRSEEKILYKYVAKNKETSKIETGYFSAFSKLDVLSFLISENYEVYEITPQSAIGRSLNLFLPKFSSNDLDFFLTQLSTFLKSGITLIESVKILSKQCKNRGQKQVYKSVIYELTMGENFSEALGKQGTVFPKLLVNMIKTSELTGDLPATLDDMANYYKEMEKTRKQMISAITYPSVILVFALTILIFIMVGVIPQFVGIYGDLGTDLPGVTVAVIKISKFLQLNWQYVALGVVGFVVLFISIYKTVKVFRTVIQTLMMNLPIVGKIIIYNEITMFTKTFASLLNHNVYITDSMEVLSKITTNEVYKMLIFDTITNLAKGEAISNSFKNQWAFPTIAYEMILTGEKTGQLGTMMDKVAEYYQIQHKNAVNQIKAFIEPVMIVVLAAIVGVILLSVVLPMFDMYQNIG